MNILESSIMGKNIERLHAALPPEAIVNCDDLKLAGSLVNVRTRTEEITRLVRMGIEGVGDQQFVAKAFIPESLARAKEQFAKDNAVLAEAYTYDGQRQLNNPDSALSRLTQATNEIQFQPDFLEDTVSLFREVVEAISTSAAVNQGVKATESAKAEISNDGVYRILGKIAPEWTKEHVETAVRRRIGEDDLAMKVIGELSQFAQQPSIMNVLKLSDTLGYLMARIGVNPLRSEAVINSEVSNAYGAVPLYTGSRRGVHTM